MTVDSKAVLNLYHFQDTEISDTPYDIFLWAKDTDEARKLLDDYLEENCMLPTLDDDQHYSFSLYNVYAENGGLVTKVDDTKKWYTPKEIADNRMLITLKGIANYRAVLYLITTGELQAKKESYGYVVHVNWIKKFNEKSIDNRGE